MNYYAAGAPGHSSLSYRLLFYRTGRTLTNPYFRSRLSPTEIEAAFARLRTEARIQSITVHVAGIATHPEDDLVLATALRACAIRESAGSDGQGARSAQSYGKVFKLSV